MLGAGDIVVSKCKYGPCFQGDYSLINEADIHEKENPEMTCDKCYERKAQENKALYYGES